MHRVRTLHILTAACVSVGLACYLLTAAGRGRTALPAHWVALAVIAVAACAASRRFRLNGLELACRELVERARQPQASPSSSPAALCPLSRSMSISAPVMATMAPALNAVADPGARPAGDAARNARELERQIADMKNDFVSMVSHELRTPLASIKAYIEMLIDGEAVDEKTTREFYDVIQNEANRLGRLIDNILNISRIESGLVKPDQRPQDLKAIVEEALEAMAPQFAEKGLCLVEDLTPVLCRTEGDLDMLYQAVLNLLSNTVKYTPNGGTVTVRTEVDQAGGKVVTRIIDTGVGVPQHDLPFVFEKFYRAEAGSGCGQGTGLGLSLVKQIIETIHHGRVFVESEVGKGSTFGFELKLCQ